MKVWIDEDEYYPWYIVKTEPRNEYDAELELPAHVVALYLAAEKAFGAARDKLVEALEEVGYR